MTGKRSPLVTVTVASLVDCFRDGLIALSPIAERSGIVWRGDDVYDPWENIESDEENRRTAGGA